MKRGAKIAAALAALSVAILLADYAVAARRAPRDDSLIKSMQKQAQQDPAISPKLAAEQKRITDARLARKRRDNVLAWYLISFAAAFLACAKRAGLASPPAHSGKPETPTARKTRSAGPRTPATPSPALDLSFVDEAVARFGRGKEAAIPLLQAIQTHYRHLPDEALGRLCDLTDITPAEISGTSSFYGQFRRSPVGEHVVRVCHGTACHVSGARQITDELRRYLAIPEGSDTDPERLFTLDEVACLGCCSLAPVLMVDSHTAGHLTPASACQVLQPFEQRKEPA